MAGAGVAAVVVAGAAVTALGQIRQGQAAKNAADFSGDLAKQQAARETDNAEIRARDFAKDQSRRRAASIAQGGASGKELFTGSHRDVDEDTEAEVEVTRQRLLNQGAVSSQRLIAQGGLTESQGRNSQEASRIAAGGSLLSGAGEAFTAGKAARK